MMKFTEWRSDSRFWIISATTFVALVFAITLVSWYGIDAVTARECKDNSNNDLWNRCNDLFQQRNSRISIFLTIISIVVSSISTVALIITIMYSARATKAAAEASDASRISVELTRDSIRRELRPYMTASQLNNNHVRGSDGNISSRSLGLVWENVGSTPALNVHSRCNLLIFDGDFPQDFDFPDVENQQSDVGVIGTGKTFQSNSRLISLDEVREVIAGSRKLRLWGWVEYDGFEQNQRFRTEYHVEVVWYNAVDADDPDLLVWYTFMHEFNGLDDNCMRKPK